MYVIIGGVILSAVYWLGLVSGQDSKKLPAEPLPISTSELDGDLRNVEIKLKALELLVHSLEHRVSGYEAAMLDVKNKKRKK